MAVTNRNNAVDTARAFATYALVPYLGILFCPGALVFGSIGVVKSYGRPGSAGRTSSITAMGVATLELAAQLTLWWILYKVPEWSRAVN